jgi:hypothetical protein
MRKVSTYESGEILSQPQRKPNDVTGFANSADMKHSLHISKAATLHLPCLKLDLEGPTTARESMKNPPPWHLYRNIFAKKIILFFTKVKSQWLVERFDTLYSGILL